MEIVYLFIFVITIVLTFVTASMARKKGRSGFGWFIIACFISPYITMIVLACLGDTEEMRKKKIESNNNIKNTDSIDNDTKTNNNDKDNNNNKEKNDTNKRRIIILKNHLRSKQKIRQESPL